MGRDSVQPVTAALSLRDLEFAYGKGASIRGVSLQLQPGDCYGFLGHNGAGKTTVMRLALGLLRPQRGSVRIFGIDALTDPVAARAQAGALIERPGFHLQATASENLRVLAQLQGMSRREAVAEGDRVLELTGLRAARDRRVGTFSLGMRQRLGIAQALLGMPRLLLLDEPTGGLDPEGIADLRRLLVHLTRYEGTAVLVSSHQLAELDGLCNRIGVLREGAMVVEGDLAHLRGQLAARHVVTGTSLEVLERFLREDGLAPVRDDHALHVDLGARRPAAVLRALQQVGEVDSFAPESISLETIYLRASTLQSQQHAEVVSTAGPAAALQPRRGSARRPLLRAWLHELRVLGLQRSSALLLLPCIVGAWSVLDYHGRVLATSDRVRRGELFSADEGSGHLATAHALQSAVPLLALCILWLASQSMAADYSGDTLRNTLLRPLRRVHVLLGKFLALATTAVVGWAATSASVVGASALAFGFRDLEDVSKHGDRQVLADARDVAPVMLDALGNLLLPVVATAAVGLMVSTLSKRPARALMLSLVLLLGLESARGHARGSTGWLLSSHLPVGLRDDSAVGYFASIARGAADANWQFADLAVWAPVGWTALALLASGLALSRLRIS